MISDTLRRMQLGLAKRTDTELVEILIVIISMTASVYGQTDSRTITGHNREAQLLSYLLEHYDTRARPVSTHGEQTSVTISLMMHQIVNLDTVGQALNWLGWVAIEWEDNYLTWTDVEDFDGIDEIHMPLKDIWVPEVYVLNSINNNFDITSIFAPTKALIKNTGHVIWLTTATFITNCEIDVRLFPFDTQDCPVTIGTRPYSEKHITLSVGTNIPVIDKIDFVKNGEWDILAIHGKNISSKVSYSEHKFQAVQYLLKLKRNPLFYLYNLLLPGILVLIIGSIVFFIPPQSGEKISLSITALLTMVIFLLILIEFIPETSQAVPLIGRIFGAATCMLSVSTILAVWVSNVHFHGDEGHDLPPRLVAIINGPLAALLGLKSSRRIYKRSMQKHREDSTPVLRDIKVLEADKQQEDCAGVWCKEHLYVLQDILQELRSKRRLEAEQANVTTEWHVLATFLDRLLFLLYVFILAVVLLSIVLST